jgi:hypothetical protein
VPPFDPRAAEAFLREQAECLGAGLGAADDPLAVRAVLRSHDGGHERWLSLIAAVSSLDSAAGDTLAALYAFHGRVAGSLERRRCARDGGRDPLGALLAARLEVCTTAGVAAMREALAAPPE